MLKLNHVSIAVKDISKFAELYETLFDIKFSPAKHLNSQKIYLRFGKTEGAELELISPSSADSPISKFLEKRGEGLHHICLEVDNLDVVLDDLGKKGVEIIGTPTIGGSGQRIVFLDPRSTGAILIELKEK